MTAFCYYRSEKGTQSCFLPKFNSDRTGIWTWLIHFLLDSIAHVLLMTWLPFQVMNELGVWWMILLINKLSDNESENVQVELLISCCTWAEKVYT